MAGVRPWSAPWHLSCFLGAYRPVFPIARALVTSHSTETAFHKQLRNSLTYLPRTPVFAALRALVGTQTQRTTGTQTSLSPAGTGEACCWPLSSWQWTSVTPTTCPGSMRSLPRRDNRLDAGDAGCVQVRFPFLRLQLLAAAPGT